MEDNDMIFISHRGNVSKRVVQKQNQIVQIIQTINAGYQVEIDVWYINDTLFLGHDYPKYHIDIHTLLQLKNKLWFHCKDLFSFNYLIKRREQGLRYFFHNIDQATLTSNYKIWTFPGKQLFSNSIAVLPQTCNYQKQELDVCYGICSDNIQYYRGIYS